MHSHTLYKHLEDKYIKVTVSRHVVLTAQIACVTNVVFTYKLDIQYILT